MVIYGKLPVIYHGQVTGKHVTYPELITLVKFNWEGKLGS